MTTASPNREIEIKVPVPPEDLEAVRRKAEELGFRRVSAPTREENLLFDFPDRRLADAGCALRLRRYGDDVALTFKGPRRDAGRMKVREETETTVGAFRSAREILESLGLGIRFRYTKEREKFRFDGPGTFPIELCVDRTPVGCFVEIEGPPGEIRRLAREFGWSAADFETRNYVELYEAKGFGT